MAAPAYLQRAGLPASVHELARHECLVHTRKSLPGTPPTGLNFYVIYPARNNLPKRVRAFLDHLRDWARSPPDWAQPPVAQ